MRFKAVLYGLAFSLGAGVVALAAEKINPEEVRIITQTKATSDCIGDPKTPVCAVETFMACMKRQDMSLCNKVGVFKESDLFYQKPGRVSYRILSVRIVEKKDIPHELRYTYWKRPGYVDVVIIFPDVTESFCPGETKGCSVNYSLKPTPTGWEIYFRWVLRDEIKIDPAQVRIITPTETTSDCINDPKTPVCAIDTFFACIVRRDVNFCRKVGIKKPCFGPKNAYAQYQVDRIETISEEELQQRTYLPKNKRVGDVIDVIYQFEICLKGNWRCGALDNGAVETLMFDGRKWIFALFPMDANRCDPDPD